MPTTKTATLLDKRRIKNDNSYPVKLRVTFERKQRYYPIPFDFTEPEFERIMFSQRLSEPEKIIKKKVGAFENKAIDVIKELPVFTWERFEKLYFADRSGKSTIDQAFTDYASQLRSEGRIGTAVSYECAQSSLNKFMEGVKFTDVTPKFLKKYEDWMLNQDNSITTVGIYLRSLRALFNNAIGDGALNKDFYPFGKRKYEIPTSKNIKKALPLKEIGIIYRYIPDAGSLIERSKDFWVFMYLANGINVKDLALLQYENIKDDVLEFIRAKTIRTKRLVEPIRIILTDDLKGIIKKWGNIKKDGYIFPILENGADPVRERQLIQQATHLINDHMEIIAEKLGISRKPTTYVARHSFSTVLKRSGASIEFISESLGHSNVKTTANYLAGFEDETKKEYAKALTAFPEET